MMDWCSRSTDIQWSFGKPIARPPGMIGEVHRKSRRYTSACIRTHFKWLRFGTVYESGTQETQYVTHSPKDRNYEVCLRAKMTRSPCRRRIGEALPRAEKFRELLTAGHNVSMKEVNLEIITDTQSWYEILPLNGRSGWWSLQGMTITDVDGPARVPNLRVFEHPWVAVGTRRVSGRIKTSCRGTVKSAWKTIASRVRWNIQGRSERQLDIGWWSGIVTLLQVAVDWLTG